MAYEKGKKKTGGRAKGSQNKTTVAQKEAFDSIMLLIEKRLLDGNDVVNNLSVGRVADLYVNMLNYKKPKLSASKIIADIDSDISITVSYTDDFGIMD